MYTWFKNYPNVLFFFFVAVMTVSYYDGVLEKEPMNMHLWRQTDCLSLARNYANGAAFAEPEIDILLADKLTTGKTAGEFPVLYYLVGKTWSVFGESVMLYRVFYLLILLAGVFAFFRTLLLLNFGNFWSTVLSLLLFTSPVFVVFGVSFLTDVPAFCFILIAFYFLVRSIRIPWAKYSLWWAVLFFALAGLIKVSSLILFVFLGAAFLIELLGKKLSEGGRVFQRPGATFIGFGIVILAVFSWYFYASYYNEQHQFKYTFNSIYPLWLMDEAGLAKLWDGMKTTTTIIFFSRPMIALVVLLPLVNLLFFRKLPLIISLGNIFVFTGGLLYFLLWAPLFENHDYYYIPLLILFVSSFVPFFYWLKERKEKIYRSPVLKVLFVLFLGYNFIYCLSVVKLKTRAAEGDFPVVGNEQFVGMMRWVNWDVSANWWRYKAVLPDLEKAGVQPDDKVICLSDYSFSVSLYFLNKRGWTNFMHYSSREEIDQLIDAGAKYLFITDPAQLELDYIQPFLEKPLGEFKGIHVFTLAG